MKPPGSRGAALLTVALATVLVLTACGNGNSQSYPSDLDDNEFDLAIMQLTLEDMPFEGMSMVIAESFANAEWAQVFARQDPLLDEEQKLIQLDAQGRVLGHLTLFSWEEPTRNLGKVIQVESHAIIYRDEQTASNAITQRACGLLIGDDRPLEPFEVPRVADESAGFFHQSDFGVLGVAVDTVVCFRTGRLVHAVVQNGLDGTQSIERTLELAQRKLAYVEAAFDGTDPPPGDQG